MTEQNKRSISAKKRAEEQRKFDPMFFKRKGSNGGQVSGIAKGFSAMSPEKAKEIQAKGVATRMKNREKNN